MKLRQIITTLIASATIAIGIAVAPAMLAPAPALAACNSSQYTLESGIDCGAPSSASQTGLFGNGGLFQKIADLLIYIVGAISVIMVIIGGLRYVLSAGNPSGTAGAKDTILYAIIGIIVAALAFAIVSFVSTRFG